ncbi:MAG: sulfatase-like hydrolase/transferase [Opitutaceae bacterium]
MNSIRLVIGILALCWGGLSVIHAKPNIIVILTDDMGYSDIGCYGSEIETPNLDALAAGGLRFSQFYNTSRCSPTRSSLITGLYSHQAGMGLLTKDEGLQNPGYRGHLMERSVTIAEVLGGIGYRSIMTGKWHMGVAKPEWLPLARGFDRFYGCPQGGGFYFRPSSWKAPRTIVRGNEVLYDQKTDPPRGWYATDAFTYEGLEYVKEAVEAKQPFVFQGKALERKNPIFFEHVGNRAVRQGKWKLVALRGKPWELYDMKVDRTELNELSNKMPEKVAAMSVIYDAWAKRAFVNKIK